MSREDEATYTTDEATYTTHATHTHPSYNIYIAAGSN